VATDHRSLATDYWQLTTVSLLLYYITDRTQFSGNENQRQEQLLDRIALATLCGVDFIQLREKDLCGREFEKLARGAIEVIRPYSGNTRMLINSRADISLAVGADGVHLRSKDLSPVDVHRIWRAAGQQSKPVLAVSCHAVEEVSAGKSTGADFVVFAPVFEKKDAASNPGVGLEALRAACQQQIPVLALGGITAENAQSCLNAGAKGVAGIRLFQQGDLEQMVRRLRELGPR
jgi:thiamine-phosphate pyrophosphorylase